MQRTVVIAAAGAVALVVVVLAVAQLVLPGVAEQRLRDQLSRSGTVLEVKVSAFPAIELLWHRADSVVIRLGRYRSTSGPFGGTLAQTADVGWIDASAQEVDVGLVVLRSARLTKRGDQLTGSATVDEADLVRAVPFLDGVVPIASGDGRLVLRGTASFLGLSATVDAIVAADNGALVVAPDVPFGGLATIRLFSEPHVYVQGVSATAVPGGFTLSGTARVR
jgi:LmeA-like phospholipid-binding